MRTPLAERPTQERRELDRDHRNVFDHLSTWETGDLLSHEQAEAIRTFERRHTAEAPRVPLIAEVVAYLGAALAMAAVVALASQFWDEISRTQRLIGAAAFAVAFLAAGWILRRSAEPAVRRLVGVLWTLSVASLTGLLGLLFFDLPAGQDPAPWALFAMGAIAAAYARVLHVLRPASLLQVALFGLTMTAIGGAGAWAIESGWTWLDEHMSWVGVSLVVLSLLWIAAGQFGVMRPKAVAMTIGSAGAVIGPLFAMDDAVGFGLLLGLGVSIALLVGSTLLREPAFLAFGAIGLFGYLVGTIIEYLSDSIGTPLALLLSGVVLLVIAVVVMRLRRFTTPASDG